MTFGFPRLAYVWVDLFGYFLKSPRLAEYGIVRKPEQFVRLAKLPQNSRLNSELEQETVPEVNPG